LVYYPRFTALLQQAQEEQKRRGGDLAQQIHIIEGIEILLAQGLAQFEIWTHKKAPRPAIVEALLVTFKDGAYASPRPFSLTAE
jgi:shikimate 5-dehydrogenase